MLQRTMWFMLAKCKVGINLLFFLLYFLKIRENVIFLLIVFYMFLFSLNYALSYNLYNLVVKEVI